MSTSSLAEAGSASSLSGGLLSPGTGDFSQDEDERDAESDEDSDRYEDLSSDGKLLINHFIHFLIFFKNEH